MTDSSKQHTLALYHQQGVADLFDEYADTFDDHLVQGLRYDVPNLLLKSLPPSAPETFKRCLDLGCGTGLAGVVFRDRCSYLEGCDISVRMVAKTKERVGVYDKAEHGTLLGRMKKKKEASFDLILSADVFMYVLDMAAVFEAVKRVLRDGGWFVFSTESLGDDEEGAGEGSIRRSSDRFAHNRKFILSLASDDFDLVSVENHALRMDEGVEIRGDIYVLTRNRRT